MMNALENKGFVYPKINIREAAVLNTRIVASLFVWTSVF